MRVQKRFDNHGWMIFVAPDKSAEVCDWMFLITQCENPKSRNWMLFVYAG